MNIIEYFENKKILKNIKKEFVLNSLDKEMSASDLLTLTKKYKAIKSLIDTAPNLTSTDIISIEKRNVIEQSILSVITDMPNILRLRSYRRGYFCTTTIANRALANGFYDIVKFALQDPHGCTNVDEYGNNLGMDCANSGHPDLAEIALDNAAARTQQDDCGRNIGMLLADATNSSRSQYVVGKPGKNAQQLRSEYDNAILKALSYDDCSTQQDKDGFNIGMYCVNQYLNPNCFWSAVQNEQARTQTNNYGDTMCDMAIGIGYKAEDITKRTGNDIVTENIERFKSKIQSELGM